MEEEDLYVFFVAVFMGQSFFEPPLERPFL